MRPVFRSTKPMLSKLLANSPSCLARSLFALASFTRPPSFNLVAAMHATHRSACVLQQDPGFECDDTTDTWPGLKSLAAAETQSFRLWIRFGALPPLLSALCTSWLSGSLAPGSRLQGVAIITYQHNTCLRVRSSGLTFVQHIRPMTHATTKLFKVFWLVYKCNPGAFDQVSNEGFCLGRPSIDLLQLEYRDLR